jgi:hypothetical protein
MTVVDLIPGDIAYAEFQLGNLYNRIPDIYGLEVVRPPKWERIGVSLIGTTNIETKKLFKSGQLKPNGNGNGNGNGKTEIGMPSIRFREHTSLELVGDTPASIPLLFNFSPGSSIKYKDVAIEEVAPIAFINNAKLNESSRVSQIDLGEGRIAGLPILVEAGLQQKWLLKIEVPKDIRIGEQLLFRVMQRNRQGKIIGGISVQVNIRDKKKGK